MMVTPPPSMQSDEQLRYAGLMEWGARLGIAVLLVTFTLYASGMIQADIAPEQWATLWNKPLHTYLELTARPTGWGWLHRLDRGDYLSLSGIAILAGSSMASVLALVPLYWRRQDRVYAVIAVLQVLVLLLAASGLIRAGH